MRRERDQRGFTLIEMMVVVAIIGLLSLMFISLSARTYGTNADNIADEVTAQLNFAHSRAVSMRRYHCVEVKNSKIIVYQSIAVGMANPTPACPGVTAWQVVQQWTLPINTSIATVQATAHGGSGNSVTPTTGLDDYSSIIFKPDGSLTSNTGATIFISDATGIRQDRVIVYGITGDVYARKVW